MTNNKIARVVTSSLFIFTLLFTGCDTKSFFANATADKPLTLTAENTQVVIAPGACPAVKFAADELTNYLAQVLGGPVKIVDAAAPVDAKSVRVPVDAAVTLERDPPVSIVLGTNSLSSAAGVHPEKLPRDSFIIKATAQTSSPSTSTSPSSSLIFIAGCDDPAADIHMMERLRRSDNYSRQEIATIFGVYDFLERFAGCRFYFLGPLGTIVPKAKQLTVPVGTITETPAYVKRMWYSPGGSLMRDKDLGFDWKPWDERRFGFLQGLCLRRSTVSAASHALRHMQLWERFGKEHPEYFVPYTREHNGHGVHICWSSEIFEEIYRDCKAYLSGQPASSRGYTGDWPGNAFWGNTVFLNPDDGFVGCSCEKCRAYYSTGEMKGQYASELVWSKTAEIAQRLKADGFDATVSQSAYSYYTRRPKNMTLPDNVVPSVCYNGPWSEGSSVRRDYELGEIRGWSEFVGGAKVNLHNWALKYGALNIPDLPCWTPRAIGHYYARVAPYVRGVFMESSSDRAIHVFMNHYILAKTTWNPAFDADAAMEEHYRLMYGPAAPEMKAFFDDLEDCWLNRLAAGEVTLDALGPVYKIPNVFEIWRTIYTEEKLAEWQRLFAEAKKKVDGLTARRVELMRRNVLEPVIKARKGFADWTDAAQEELRRKREGVKNLLDKEYAAEFYVPDGKSEKDRGKATKRTRLIIPYVFDSNTTYRLSYFIEAKDVVRTRGGYRFNGANVGLWARPGWVWPSKTGAIIGSTYGRVHQSMTFKGSIGFRPDEYPKDPGSHGISIWLRGATGRMKVDGLILEKVEGKR